MIGVLPDDDHRARIASKTHRLHDGFRRACRFDSYVSATPAKFEIQNSIVGNESYIPHLRARIGEAKVAIARGNMPSAEQILDETIHRATGETFADVRSRALHDRATVAGLRGQYDQAINPFNFGITIRMDY